MAVTTIEVSELAMFVLAIVAILVGTTVNGRVAALRTSGIPPAVTGGLLFAALAWVARAWPGVEFAWPGTISALLLLVFFSGLGLSAKFAGLKQGGAQVALLCVAIALTIFMQNAVGIALARAFGQPAALGLFVASFPFLGGHGTASREGGSSLTFLSGLVAGNFSAFWTGMVFYVLMLIAYFASLSIPGAMIPAYASIFAFGLVAFGMLGMGPVTIAVDSYGPVTDNAQSIYELSLIESKPGVSEEIQRDYGFKPDFEKAKHYLEANDGGGNTFKATAKRVLIGTAVVGATTMIFSLILVIKNTLGIQPEAILSILNPYSILGFICGGAVIYWFTGASTQAVTTGAYRAVEYIKKNINLDENASMSASTENTTSAPSWPGLWKRSPWSVHGGHQQKRRS